MRKFLLTVLAAAVAFAVGNYLGERKLAAKKDLHLKFVEAVENGQTSAVNQLFGQNPDLGKGMAGQQFDSQLLTAAKMGYGDIIKALIFHGANPNAVIKGTVTDISDKTPLIEAASNGQGTAVDILLENGADPNLLGFCRQSALMVAAGSGQTKIMETLIKKGARSDIRDCGNGSALEHSVSTGSLSAVKLLLANDANKDKHEIEYLLMRAIEHNDLGITNALLDQVPDINVEVKMDADLGSWTPLAWAAKSGFADIVKTLIAHGADPAKKDKNGKTAVKHTKSTQIIRLLNAAKAGRK